VIIGDIGSSPGPSRRELSIFRGATLVGINHGSDAVSAAAQIDVSAIHARLSSLPVTSISSALAGVTLRPGVYWSAAYNLEAHTTLTFDAVNASGSDAIFILVSPGSVTISEFSSMELQNGAQARHIVWAVQTRARFFRYGASPLLILSTMNLAQNQYKILTLCSFSAW
jgi:hypothetical protein